MKFDALTTKNGASRNLGVAFILSFLQVSLPRPQKAGRKSKQMEFVGRKPPAVQIGWTEQPEVK